MWTTTARRLIVDLADGGQDFSADDLLARVGKPPTFRQMGAAFSAASRMGLIQSVGAVVTSDGRCIRVWRGCAR